MEPFEQLSYRAQVKRLRGLAKNALDQFPIKNYKLDFINHGENTTFKITAKMDSFLLRLHRDGYHSKAAIL